MPKSRLSVSRQRQAGFGLSARLDGHERCQDVSKMSALTSPTVGFETKVSNSINDFVQSPAWKHYTLIPIQVSFHYWTPNPIEPIMLPSTPIEQTHFNIAGPICLHSSANFIIVSRFMLCIALQTIGLARKNHPLSGDQIVVQ